MADPGSEIGVIAIQGTKLIGSNTRSLYKTHLAKAKIR